MSDHDDTAATARDKTLTHDDVVARLASGMTIGIGGWGSRRKPMSLVRAIARSDLTDLTIVSYGGPDVGILCALGKVRRVVYGFVSLDSIPLEPHFRAARQAGTVQATEYDEGMFYWGLYAAANRLPFLPTRAGLGSSVMEVNPNLRTVVDPYGGEELVAMPALHLDAALVHLNRADDRGNAQYLGPDLYFDDLFLLAAQQRFVSAERIVPTEQLLAPDPDTGITPSLHTLRINRSMVDGVVAAPNGAHFTSCVPDYDRDEAFQRAYAATAKDPDAWAAFRTRYLDVSEDDYQAAVADDREAAR
jgi:glutaconate CoA-transferase, subunit A